MPVVTDCGFFVLRTPLLSFDEVVRWGESLSSAMPTLDNRDITEKIRTFDSDVITVRSRMGKLLERPEIRQALAVASPSVLSSIAIWKRDPHSKKGLQAERSLARYLYRMAGRSTPFGVFSGCSIGNVRPDRPTVLTLGPQSGYKTSTRLDFDYLFALTSQLRKDPQLLMTLRYEWNSSLYKLGNSWHYVETLPSGHSRSHRLVRLISDEYLERAIACARQGGRTFAEIIAAVRSSETNETLADDEIDEYVRDLIKSEVVVPSILPSVTGASPLGNLITQLSESPIAEELCKQLVDIRESLCVLDKSLGVDPEQYSIIANKLRSLPAKVDESRLLQVDLFKPVVEASINQAVLDEVYGALDVLDRLASRSEPSTLSQFRQSFMERYEQEWIPLVEALDWEAGIGYGANSDGGASPLLKDFPLRIRQGARDIRLNRFQSFLLQKIVDCPHDDRKELELRPTELPLRESQTSVLPQSFSIMASLAADSPEALRQGQFEVVYRGGIGPSSARWLGRFCSADQELEALVRDTLREEESHEPDAVYAEIVYLPEGRIGNVLCRPVLRDYEIPCLGRSGADVNRQLPPNDLMIGVREGKLMLYSERLSRRVIPRLSNAHNYGNTGLSPLYRFLCDLQNQDGKYVPQFNWGPLDRLRALPRVRVGRVVLAPAQWRISSAESRSIVDADRYTAFLKMKELQRVRGLPRWVLLSEGDNTLPVDLNNPLSIDALLHILRRSSEAKLVEMYPQPDRQCVTGPEGAYQHEILLPLKTTPDPQVDNGENTRIRSNPSIPARRIERYERFLAPGSEWQFIKVYGGPASLDSLLTNDIAPLLALLVAKHEIIQWFFVRYADPDSHLRLRFRSTDSATMTIARALESRLVQGGIWKVQFDTYHREIERYGGLLGVIASEEIFCADSEAVIDIIGTLDAVDDLDLRWRMALLSIDAMLNDFGRSLTERVELLDKLRTSYAKEFFLRPADKQKIGSRFRQERSQLQHILNRDFGDQDVRYYTSTQALDRRSDRIKPAIERLLALDKKGELEAEIDDVISAHLHMNVNRIMRSSPRSHEPILYDFLYRTYDGRRARDGAAIKKRPPGAQDVKPIRFFNPES